MGNPSYGVEQSAGDRLISLARRFVGEYLYQTQPLTTPESAKDMLKDYAREFKKLLADYPPSVRSQIEIYLNRLSTLPLMIEQGENKFKPSLRIVAGIVLSINDCFYSGINHTTRREGRESFLDGLERRINSQEAYLDEILDARNK